MITEQPEPHIWHVTLPVLILQRVRSQTGADGIGQCSTQKPTRNQRIPGTYKRRLARLDSALKGSRVIRRTGRVSYIHPNQPTDRPQVYRMASLSATATKIQRRTSPQTAKSSTRSFTSPAVTAPDAQEFLPWQTVYGYIRRWTLSGAVGANQRCSGAASPCNVSPAQG